jgi:hypothetical protein
MTSIDTHVHFLISKVAEPDWRELAFFVEAARGDGLDHICVSEHLDALHYESLVRGIFEEMRLGGEMLHPGVIRLGNGLVLSSAAEVALRGGGDVGVHARPEVLLALRREKGAYTVRELLDGLVADVDRVAVVAHHYYWANKSFDGLSENASRIDGLELPAKDLRNEERYRSLSASLSLPLIGASDAHTWVQAGSCHSVIADGDSLVLDHGTLKRLMRKGALTATPIEHADERVRISKLLRQHMENAVAA